MADLATLKIAVDSRPVDQASNDLDELATSANRAERATAGLTNQTKATGAAMAGMNNAVRQAKAAQEAAAQAMGGVAGRTKLASHEITNLAFQFQDLGVQIAGGANPLTAFVQQGSQISGIMMQSGMSIGVFTKAVGSMIATAAGAVLLNPIFLGVAAAVGGTALAFKGFSDQIENKAPVDEYIKSLGLTKEEAAKLKDTHVTLGDAARAAWNMIKEGLGLDEVFSTLDGWVDNSASWLYNAFKQSVASVYGAFKATFDNITFIYSNMPALLVDAARAGFNGMINIMQGAINAAISGLNYLAQKSNEVFGTSFGQFGKIDLSAYKATYSAAGQQLGTRFASSFNAARAQALAGFDKWEAATLAERNKRLSDQADEIIDNRKKSADKASKDAGKEAEKLAKELAELELRVMNGLTDTMRELHETISAITAGDVVQMMDEINKRSDERVKLANAETEARVKTNEELVKTVDYLDQVFGLDGNLGKLFGALKSGFSDVFDAIGGAFGGLRDSVSNLLANLGTSFKQVAAGAAIGGIAAQATGGSALGGTIGGGIGQALGSKFLSSALGSFAGPLGSIAGGLLGGLIGGLFSGTKQASATLSSIGGNAVISGITGNNAQLKGVANNMATGLLKGIGNIAEQLGGQLGGAVSLSIGQRKKDFVVDPTGKGRTKGAGVINFGEDQAAAIAYATQLAIQQGIITGLSAGANALIKVGGDLQAQLDKALKFDQVFKDLRKETDPLGAALAELSTEFDKLQVIFKEAGASAADYAALEDLYAIKRRKATMEAERPRRELEIQLMELSGDAAGALAAQRQLELEAMDATLQGLQRRIYAQQDLSAANDRVAEAEQALADAMAAERQRAIDGMRAEITALDAIIARRADAQAALRAAYDAEMERFEKEIAGRRDAISAIEDTISNLKGFAKSIRDFANSIVSVGDAGTQSLDAMKRQFQQVLGLAATGNQEAIGQITEIGGKLQEAIIAGATDRVSMLRDLYGLRGQALGAAENIDTQIVGLQTQADREFAMIALLEVQKADLTTMVGQFIELNAKVLSVDEAIRQLQTAEAAAANAEVQKAALEQQIAQLSSIDNTVLSVLDAQRQLEVAKVARDELLAQINIDGFNSVVNAINSSASAISGAVSSATISGNYIDPNLIVNSAVNDNFNYGGGIGGAWDWSNLNVSAFANGGLHSGGLRLVGENGPELEATGPSRIYNANQLGNMIGGGATAEEVRALRDELKVVMFQIAKNTGKTSEQLQRWDGDGLPDARGF